MKKDKKSPNSGDFLSFLYFHYPQSFYPINSFITIKQTAPGKPNKPNYDTCKKV